MSAPWFTWVHEEYGQGKDVCLLVYLVIWRVKSRKGCLSPGLPGYMMSMGKERMSAPWFTWLYENKKSRKGCLSPGLPGYMMSMGKERMSSPWFTWLHDEYRQGKDVYLLVYLVMWRVKSRKGCLSPGLPGYMKSKIKERMPVSWFTWVHDEYGQGKNVCPLVYLVTWRVKSRKECLPPGLPGYMKSKIKERMSASWFTWLHEE